VREWSSRNPTCRGEWESAGATLPSLSSHRSWPPPRSGAAFDTGARPTFGASAVWGLTSALPVGFHSGVFLSGGAASGRRNPGIYSRAGSQSKHSHIRGNVPCRPCVFVADVEGEAFEEAHPAPIPRPGDERNLEPSNSNRGSLDNRAARRSSAKLAHKVFPIRVKSCSFAAKAFGSNPRI
jgi:hypothetical protein